MGVSLGVGVVGVAARRLALYVALDADAPIVKMETLRLVLVGRKNKTMLFVLKGK